jgi:hypothetical protein
MRRDIARWEARSGKRFVQLYREGDFYFYETDAGGGSVGARTDEEAVAAMTAPWGPTVGPVTVLTSDFPSTRRVR